MPFMDESLLMKSLDTVYGQLTAEEQYRNRIGSDLLLVDEDQPLATWLRKAVDSADAVATAAGECVVIWTGGKARGCSYHCLAHRVLLQIQ